jgi:hypothetical protein
MKHAELVEVCVFQVKSSLDKLSDASIAIVPEN